MKKAAFICFSLVPLLASPQSREIEKVIIDAFEEVVSTYDSDKLTTYFTDDFLLLEHGEIWNNDTLNALFKRALTEGPVPQRNNELTFIDILIDDKVAWASWDNKAEFYVEDSLVRQAHWLESCVLVKEGSTWKIQMLHSTRIEQ